MMMSSNCEPLAPSVCCQMSRIESSEPLGEMNSLRFMSSLTPWVAFSYEPQSKPRPPMNLVKLPPPTMMSSPEKPFMTSPPATPPIMTSLPQ